MNPTFSISEAEWHVMVILWKKSPLSSHQIIECLKSHEWSDSTIKTMLARLVKKEVIAFEKIGKNFYYRPLVSEKKSQKNIGRQFMDRIFGGSVSPLLQHFVEEHPLSSEEIDQLQKILKQKKK